MIVELGYQIEDLFGIVWYASSWTWLLLEMKKAGTFV
jgi:hypothetical protein